MRILEVIIGIIFLVYALRAIISTVNISGLKLKDIIKIIIGTGFVYTMLVMSILSMPQY